ncbi:MAG: general secretion pathway protein GspK [Desulfamplus sp.]|nr:general secretion pathway protein GspK [Desulfamplus sp.]
MKSFISHSSMNNRGMALLITLAVVAILTAAALELARRAGDGAAFIKRSADHFSAREMALSGIELAKVILIRDAEIGDTDSVQDIWADSEKMLMAPLLLGYDPGNLTIKISDELGKIQINALLKEFPGHELNMDQALLWERFLDILISSDKSFDTRDPAEILNALKDWLDSGDDNAITGLSGAESQYYRSLDPPVVCPNAPMDRVEELFMVKGFPREILDAVNDKYGHDYSNISSFFTVYGMDRTDKSAPRFYWPGRININTADAAVLAGILPGGMENQAPELVDFRVQKGEDGRFFVNSLDREWYKRVIDLSPKEKRNFDSIIRYETFIFSVEARARIDNTQSVVKAVLRREKNSSGKWQCNVIQLMP